MSGEQRSFSVLRSPHVSEKSSMAMEKNNTVIFRVARNATKFDIKLAVSRFFEVEIDKVNTLVVKGKMKRQGKRIGYRSNWKKAYVTLKTGHSLDFGNAAEEIKR